MNSLSWEITPLWVISITDVLDMAIIAFVIYKISIWIKDTKAASLFKGVALILAISGVSSWLQFRTIQWLVSSLFNVGIIATVILFHPELRKVLEEIGRGRFSPHMKISNEEIEKNKFVNEIISSVTSMAKVKTGALIVIENKFPLNEIEKTGVLLDALVSRQLLLNIFAHNAPMHDGAVLVRKNRIVSASCILPLTETEIGKELGTRHRAAVGVSEVYDVTVIVVSEESGKISVAKNGKLTKNMDREKLEKILASNLSKRKRLALWKEGSVGGGQ